MLAAAATNRIRGPLPAKMFISYYFNCGLYSIDNAIDKLTKIHPLKWIDSQQQINIILAGMDKTKSLHRFVFPQILSSLHVSHAKQSYLVILTVEKSLILLKAQGDNLQQSARTECTFNSEGKIVLRYANQSIYVLGQFGIRKWPIFNSLDMKATPLINIAQINEQCLPNLTKISNLYVIDDNQTQFNAAIFLKDEICLIQKKMNQIPNSNDKQTNWETTYRKRSLPAPFLHACINAEDAEMPCVVILLQNKRFPFSLMKSDMARLADDNYLQELISQSQPPANPMELVSTMDYNAQIRSIAVATVNGNIIIFKVIQSQANSGHLDGKGKYRIQMYLRVFIKENMQTTSLALDPSSMSLLICYKDKVSFFDYQNRKFHRSNIKQKIDPKKIIHTVQVTNTGQILIIAADGKIYIGLLSQNNE